MPLARLLHDLSYMRSPDPRGEKIHERGLSSMSRLRSSYTQNREDVGNQFLFPFYRGDELISIPVYLTLFVTGKVFKTVSRGPVNLFVACFNWSLLSCLFYNNSSRLLPWSFSCRVNLYSTLGLRTRIINWLTVRENDKTSIHDKIHTTLKFTTGRKFQFPVSS